jgi:hypothetical protein
VEVANINSELFVAIIQNGSYIKNGLMMTKMIAKKERFAIPKKPLNPEI